jgi:hypothetical protein
MMTIDATGRDTPHNNPCAQCGKPIGSPLWWETTERCIAYVWRCEACDYEFTALAAFAREDDQRIAA